MAWHKNCLLDLKSGNFRFIPIIFKFILLFKILHPYVIYLDSWSLWWAHGWSQGDWGPPAPAPCTPSLPPCPAPAELHPSSSSLQEHLKPLTSGKGPECWVNDGQTRSHTHSIHELVSKYVDSFASKQLIKVDPPWMVKPWETQRLRDLLNHTALDLNFKFVLVITILYYLSIIPFQLQWTIGVS